jgi:hypothetical protein
MEKTMTRGGYRQGCGRPKIGVERINVSLDEKTIDKAKKIGNGELSRGIRRAVSEFEEEVMYTVSYAGTAPVAVKAKTLAGAKRAASANCPFQGQTLKVFRDGNLVAIRAADPIDMNNTGEWENVEWL